MNFCLLLILSVHSGTGPACAGCPLPVKFQLPTEGDAFQRGLAALKENRLEDALVEFTTEEREHPENGRIHNFRGILLVQMGKNAEAAVEYQEAIHLDPLLEDAYRNLGFLRWIEHQLVPARKALLHAVELSPDDSFAHYYLGRVGLDAQQYEQAFHELELSHQPLPAEPGFLIQVATGYIALGRQDDARKSLERAMSLRLSDAQSVGVAALLLSIHENTSAINILRTLNKGRGAAQASWAQFDLTLAHLLSGSYLEAGDEALIYAKAVRATGAESAESAQAWSVIGIADAHLNHGEESVDALRPPPRFPPPAAEHCLNSRPQLVKLNLF